jgi:hypothetical protein
LVERRQGHWDQALAHLQRLVLDPLNAGLLTTIGGETLLNMRRSRRPIKRSIARSRSLRTTGWRCPTGSARFNGRKARRSRARGKVPSDGIDPGLASWAYQRLLERRYPVAIAKSRRCGASDDAPNGFGHR